MCCAIQWIKICQVYSIIQSSNDQDQLFEDGVINSWNQKQLLVHAVNAFGEIRTGVDFISGKSCVFV